jgi:hypothetical protein
MIIYYRISDGSYNKQKESYGTKEKCLNNLVSILRKQDQLVFVADVITEKTFNIIKTLCPDSIIYRTQLGHGSLSFNYALDLAVKGTEDTNTIFYFVEDDYIHTLNALEVIEDGLNLGFHYITGYDHPDKYLDPSQGGNPHCQGGAENTKVYLGQKSHFKVTNSTTMTFAVKKHTLLNDYNLIKETTNSRFEPNYPYDYHLFTKLTTQGKRVIGSALPGVCTHIETRWLAPLIDWKNI